MATITLSDIQNYAQIPTNIDGRLIDFQISLSKTLDVEPVVTKELMTAVDSGSEGTTPELIAFYNSFIVPYWCLSAYYRFVSTHGTNITQFGVTQTRDPRGTFDQSTGDARANILRQCEDDRKVFRQFMVDRLKEVDYAFDSVTFGTSKTINNVPMPINAIKKKERRPFGGSYLNRFLD